MKVKSQSDSPNLKTSQNNVQRRPPCFTQFFTPPNTPTPWSSNYTCAPQPGESSNTNTVCESHDNTVNAAQPSNTVQNSESVLPATNPSGVTRVIAEETIPSCLNLSPESSSPILPTDVFDSSVNTEIYFEESLGDISVQTQPGSVSVSLVLECESHRPSH
ncbi:hypothetical protein ACLB2K_072219 [Fragaria x ananassa]